MLENLNKNPTAKPERIQETALDLVTAIPRSDFSRQQ